MAHLKFKTLVWRNQKRNLGTCKYIPLKFHYTLHIMKVGFCGSCYTVYRYALCNILMILHLLNAKNLDKSFSRYPFKTLLLLGIQNFIDLNIFSVHIEICSLFLHKPLTIHDIMKIRYNCNIN